MKHEEIAFNNFMHLYTKLSPTVLHHLGLFAARAIRRDKKLQRTTGLSDSYTENKSDCLTEHFTEVSW